MFSLLEETSMKSFRSLVAIVLPIINAKGNVVVGIAGAEIECMTLIEAMVADAPNCVHFLGESFR